VVEVQTHEGWAPDPGGSELARNIGQCELDFNGLVVNTTTLAVAFVASAGDVAMIDLSTPTIPKPVAEGLYAYTLIVTQDGGGDGSVYTVTLVVDDDFYSITAFGTNTTRNSVTLSVTWWSTAGSPFHASIQSGGNDTYHGAVYVQKVG